MFPRSTRDATITQNAASVFTIKNNHSLSKRFTNAGLIPQKKKDAGWWFASKHVYLKKFKKRQTKIAVGYKRLTMMSRQLNTREDG